MREPCLAPVTTFALSALSLLPFIPLIVSQQDERRKARGEPHPSAAAGLARCGDGESHQKERRGGKEDAE